MTISSICSFATNGTFFINSFSFHLFAVFLHGSRLSPAGFSVCRASSRHQVIPLRDFSVCRAYFTAPGYPGFPGNINSIYNALSGLSYSCNKNTIFKKKVNTALRENTGSTDFLTIQPRLMIQTPLQRFAKAFIIIRHMAAQKVTAARVAVSSVI